MQLYEEHRPRSWDDVVGQDKVLAKLNRLRQRGLAGRAFWLSGQSGTGKTTIARLIADEIADEFCIEEVDATDLSAARIRELEKRSQTRGLGASGKTGLAFIVNESHGLNRAAVRQLLTTLERIPPHVVWVFTTTNDGQESLFDEQIDAHPLLSRCIDLPLARRGLGGTPARKGSPAKPGPFAILAQEIATAEGLNGRSIDDYIALAQRCKNNLRMMIQAIESGDMLT
jgi:replication-associated recombination protein RarA